MKIVIKDFVIQILIFCIFSNCLGKQWTEDDEKRRIAKIKEDELRQFKAEMGSGRSGFGSSDAFYGEAEQPSSGIVDYSGEAYPRYRASPQKYSQMRRPSITQPPTPIFIPSPAFITPSGNATAAQINWCFYCASPLRILSEPMQLAVQNLLDVRRAKYPKDAIVPDCNNPANIRRLPKQQCKHSYCQTLVLTEHERGVSFAIRGCAENFAAVDESILNERGDNQCVKLHGSLDLRECVCKHRKYCYRGETDDKIEAASEQVVKLFANAQNSSSKIVINFSLILLFFICHSIFRCIL